MKYETVRHCGKLGLEFSNVKGYGSRVSRDFMRNLLKILSKDLLITMMKRKSIFLPIERNKCILLFAPLLQM